MTILHSKRQFVALYQKRYPGYSPKVFPESYPCIVEQYSCGGAMWEHDEFGFVYFPSVFEMDSFMQGYEAGKEMGEKICRNSVTW